MDPTVPVDFVGLSVVQRNWLQVAVNEEIQFESFQLSQSDRNSFAGRIDLEVCVCFSLKFAIIIHLG